MISTDLGSFRVSRAAAPMALLLGLGLSVPAPTRAAATILPRIKLDASDLKRPLIIDQNGEWYRAPKGTAGGAASYATSAVPTYLGYKLDGDNPVPRGYPTIDTGPKVPGQTVGPLHLTPATQAQLNATLVQNGEAVVHSGQADVLVKPVAGTAGSQSAVSAWLAGQAAASSGANSSQNLAQMLSLDKVTKPITDSAVLKDLGRLLTFKSGKFANWNQQNLDTLKRDLRLSSPKNVATHPATAAATGKGRAAAQLLDGGAAGGPGNVLAAPVPEPGTYLIFGLGAGALFARRRAARRAAKLS